jgi:hypothetical protein
MGAMRRRNVGSELLMPFTWWRPYGASVRQAKAGGHDLPRNAKKKDNLMEKDDAENGALIERTGWGP